MDDQSAFERRLARVRACRLDLLTEGVNLRAPDAAGLLDLVTEHLEYFQAMLGDDSGAHEIVALVRHECGSSSRCSRAAPASRATPDDGCERLARRRAQVARMPLDELRAWAGELRRRAADDEQDLAVLRERLSQFATAAATGIAGVWWPG